MEKKQKSITDYFKKISINKNTGINKFSDDSSEDYKNSSEESEN